MKTSEKKNNKENEKLPYNPNVTVHDKDMLSQKNIHGDGGDDQQLRDRKQQVDFAGKDLDVPGREQAKRQTEMAFEMKRTNYSAKVERITKILSKINLYNLYHFPVGTM